MTHLHINHRLTWIALVWPEVSVPAAHQGSALLPPPAWCKSSHSLSGHMPWHTHCSCGTHATCTFTVTILIDHLAGCIAYPSNREVMRGWTSENTLSCESLGPYTLQEVSVNMCNTKFYWHLMTKMTNLSNSYCFSERTGPDTEARTCCTATVSWMRDIHGTHSRASMEKGS